MSKRLYGAVRDSSMRDVLGNAVRHRMDQRGRLHATQHLRECAMQPAQTGLKGGFVLAVLVDRSLVVDV